MPPALLRPAAALGGTGADKIASAKPRRTTIINRPVLVSSSIIGSDNHRRRAVAHGRFLH